MSNKQLFVVALLIAYFSFSAIMWAFPLLFKETFSGLLNTYNKATSGHSCYALAALRLILHMLIIISALIMLSNRKKGLLVFAISGGIWLTLQFMQEHGFALARPFAELILLVLGMLCIGKNQSAGNQDDEIAALPENEA